MFILLFTAVLTILLTFANENTQGYCSLNSKDCSFRDQPEYYLMFYEVNPPEGFNLRRDVYMRFAILLAEAQRKGQKWHLVLPPWYRLYHWRSGAATNSPLPWGKFFDISSLKSYSPVLELYEVFTRNADTILELDILYVLQNFEDPFEGGTFIDKWEIIDKDCDFDEKFWGYRNITVGEVVCVKFQGAISKLWELVLLHPNSKKIMFMHGEIPLHQSYGTKEFWDCRKSMKFNQDLIKRAEDYISVNFYCNEPKCSTYISVHWRRRDFLYGRKNDIPSIEGTASQIHKAIKTHNPSIQKVFIATDSQTAESKELDRILKELNYKVYFFQPTLDELDDFTDGGIAIIEQIICSHASYFIGTHESTFTFRIQEEREILGFDSATTFNRLCPDSGKCSRPSKWTLVN